MTPRVKTKWQAASTTMTSLLMAGAVGCATGSVGEREATSPGEAELETNELVGAEALAPKDTVAAVAQRLARGETMSALDLVDAALEGSPEDAELHLARGSVLQALRRGEDAIEAWERALSLEPSLFGALDGIGTVHLDNGRPEDAVKFFRKALDIQPDFAAGQYNYALALRQLGALDRALEAMDRARVLEPDDPEILLEQASMLEAAGRVKEARAAVHEAAVKAPNDAWVQMINGDVLTAEGAPPEAILGAYRTAVRLEPSLSAARARLLRVLFRAGSLDEAFAVTTEAMRRAPKDAGVWSDHAAVQHAQGDLQSALDSLDRALEFDPAIVAAHRRRVRVYGALARCEEALAGIEVMAAAGVDAAQVDRARVDFKRACP
jgi:tetratricopeptide (TPR) repeat protein